MVTVILVMLAIYIIYIKNNTNTETKDREQNAKKVYIDRDINIGITEFDTINPITSKSLEVQYIIKLVYLPLIEITQDFNVKEGIAKEWSKTGETEYIIKLNEMKWHNGSEVTTKDVEFTINTIKSSESVYKENVEVIEKTQIIDDKTIKLKLKEETNFFEYLLCFPIVQENTYTKENIGTGSYKIEEIIDKKIVLNNGERKIEINIYDSVSELYNQLSKEKIDILITQNSEYPEYIRNIGITEQLIPGRDFYYITFSQKIIEEELSKTIKDLISREQIIYELYKNKYIVADFPLDYGSYLTEKIEIKAEGNKLPEKLTLGVMQDEEMIKMAEIIKRQLEENKIKTSIRYYSDFETAVRNNYYDIIINKKTVEITPKIDDYFIDENRNKNIKDAYKIENKEILKTEYAKMIEQYEEEMPFMGLYFNSYIILHNNKVKGDFSGNWYNPFYHIDTWYKVE